MAQTTPILLIEDNPLLRDGIASVLRRQPDLAIVAMAEGVEEALHRARETRPRVILTDATLGDADCRALVSDLRQEVPESRVIVMDLLAVDDDIVAYVRAGAAGFVTKDATPDELVNAIRTVAGGSHVLPPTMTATLFSQITTDVISRNRPDAIVSQRLTQREREVIGLIGEGLSNKEIAVRLHIATHTVKSHVHNVLEKLALHSRLQVAAYAHETGEAPDAM